MRECYISVDVVDGDLKIGRYLLITGGDTTLKDENLQKVAVIKFHFAKDGVGVRIDLVTSKLDKLNSSFHFLQVLE